MALSDTTNSNPEKPATETNKHEKREKPPTKVIIRRLPPSMTQEEFISQVSPIPDYDYLYSVKGHEYAAVVEFASFQKIPKKRGKPRPDTKIGSIENDPIYQEFLESLKQQPNQEEKPEFSYQPSTRSEKYEAYEKRDYKTRRDDYRDRERRGRFEDQKKDEYKKETDMKAYPKKVKKYSERREERKYEIRKAEQKKEDATDQNKNDKSDDLNMSKSESSLDKVASEEHKVENRDRELIKSHSGDRELMKSHSEDREDNRSDELDKSKNKENDPRVQRRIRNKDRPTMQLYQPGMLSKRKQQEDDKEPKEASVKD
ncbi:hypothetical protein Trydic_g7856 [Trypoxylus dichotomus]